MACPEKVTLTGYTLANGELSVTGMAAKDSDVAQFLVNLREQPNTYGATLVSVMENADTQGPLTRLFTVTIRLAPAPAPSVEATPAATAQGGNGQ